MSARGRTSPAQTRHDWLVSNSRAALSEARKQLLAEGRLPEDLPVPPAWRPGNSGTAPVQSRCGYRHPPSRGHAGVMTQFTQDTVAIQGAEAHVTRFGYRRLGIPGRL